MDHTYLSKEINFSQEHYFEDQVCEKENDGDNLLIDLVRSYPHLYEKSRKDYRDVQMKDNAWQEIANVMQISVSDCEIRWRRLRQYYCKERLKRESESVSGSGASKRRKWELYDSMSFIDSHIEKRKSFGSYPPRTPQSYGPKPLTSIGQSSWKVPFHSSNVPSSWNASSHLDSSSSSPSLSLNRPFPSPSSPLNKPSPSASPLSPPYRSSPSPSPSLPLNRPPSPRLERVPSQPQRCNVTSPPSQNKFRKNKDKNATAKAKDIDIEGSVQEMSKTILEASKQLISPTPALVQTSEQIIGMLVASELAKMLEPRRTRVVKSILHSIYDTN